MNYDRTEKVGKSLVQYGPNNNRIYLMKLQKEDRDEILDRLDEIAYENELTKIMAKIPDWALNRFEDKGYKIEARVPQFFGRGSDGYFMAKFLDASRSTLSQDEELRMYQVRKEVEASGEPRNNELPHDKSIRQLHESDVDSLVEIYRRVFDVYPFPIFEPEFLLKTMQEDQVYYGVFEDQDLVAVSSADMNPENEDAEMTDFATLPEYRGQNLSYHLLKFMIDDLENEDVRVLYTIARANSIGMNKTFKRMGFELRGTLVHNTLIGSTIENMNIWSRLIRN
jgi:putative beta-lysine N-acetyltransferase